MLTLKKKPVAAPVKTAVKPPASAPATVVTPGADDPYAAFSAQSKARQKEMKRRATKGYHQFFPHGDTELRLYQEIVNGKPQFFREVRVHMLSGLNPKKKDLPDEQRLGIYLCGGSDCEICSIIQNAEEQSGMSLWRYALQNRYIIKGVCYSVPEPEDADEKAIPVGKPLCLNMRNKQFQAYNTFMSTLKPEDIKAVHSEKEHYVLLMHSEGGKQGNCTFMYAPALEKKGRPKLPEDFPLFADVFVKDDDVIPPQKLKLLRHRINGLINNAANMFDGGQAEG